MKVLDFGLAKVLEDEPPASSLGNSPTLTLGHTRAGMILGTAAYMSPEQAVGRPVDRRSDIFSFGAVLFEMLTGTRAFAGTTTPDVLEAVVKTEPDWSRLPEGTPGYLRRLMERALAKDRKQRLQAIGEARIVLENPEPGRDRGGIGPLVTPPSPSRLGRAMPWVAAAVLGVVAAGVSILHFREQPPAAQLMRFEIPAPEKVALGDSLSVSPDGRHLAFTGRGTNGQTQIWVRSLETPEARPLPGTDGASASTFWSSDSRSIGFMIPRQVKKSGGSGRPGADPMRFARFAGRNLPRRRMGS